MKTIKRIAFFPSAAALKICRQRCPKIRTWAAWGLRICVLMCLWAGAGSPFAESLALSPDNVFTEACPHRLALIIYLLYSHPALMKYAQTQNCHANLKYLESSKIDR